MSNNTRHTIEELTINLQQIANGDEQAFRRLFLFYSPRLNQFAFSIVKTKEASAEIVDDVFIRLWKQREKAAAIGNIRVYLYVAVKNGSLNYLSAKAQRQFTEPFGHFDVELSTDQSPDQQMISAELQAKITAAVESLPPRCKMIFKLVREDGLRYKDVAEILNLTVNTVDAQMVIAVKRISEKVQSHFSAFPRREVKK
ncbi:RNA polymerase sigma-70 factor [Chitinophaga horti]|uniref:RNA polymerase sigma-70 factor n=1 Tax=Chitinophaga horti TaxID=2920382 RepID=A0ABY6J4J2_9BACT|nr:RNA polymerase sigma-70 factor [Chitinophaga horti]UYQ94420.1 RNA polymerase sigma-70 factor [Chitinophaga horti]